MAELPVFSPANGLMHAIAIFAVMAHKPPGKSFPAAISDSPHAGKDAPGRENVGSLCDRSVLALSTITTVTFTMPRWAQYSRFRQNRYETSSGGGCFMSYSSGLWRPFRAGAASGLLG